MEETISTAQTNETKHPFESGKLGKLIFKFSLPCVMSLLIASLYNMVDQIFIGQGVGLLGNGATTVVYPLTVIALAIALLIGDGCAAFMSICQGKKDSANASKAWGNSIICVLVISVILTVLVAIFSNFVLGIFGATEANLPYAKEYLNVILIGLPFYMFGTAVNAIIRADGSPQFALISNLSGCVINLILDPIAIFVLKWGMTGAALATIIGQIVTAALAFIYLFRTKTMKFKKTDFILNGKVVRSYLTLGISSFLTQVSIVLTLAVMNNVMAKYGAESIYGSDIPLTIMGIIMKMFAVAVAFVVGIAAGCQPIVGFNYGAGNYKRVKAIFKIMIIAEIVVGVIATLLFELLPVQILSLFGSVNDELYTEFGKLAFRIYLSSMIVCCVQKSSAIFLQSIGKPVFAMTLSLARDFVLMTVLTIVLPMFLGVTGALYSAPISDAICLVLTVIFVLIVFKTTLSENKKKNINETPSLPESEAITE
jgi:Na+-driven multidrug efflux pump